VVAGRWIIDSVLSEPGLPVVPWSEKETVTLKVATQSQEDLNDYFRILSESKTGTP